MYCPRCGTDNREHAQFCEKCGMSMPQVAAAGGSYPPPPAPSPQYAAPQPQYAPQYAPQPAMPSPSGGLMRDPGIGVVDPAGRRFAQGKNPAVAMILSFLLTGIGQIYNGDVKKCLLMWGICIVLIFLAVATGGVAGIAVLGVWIWSIIDAYNVASRKSPIW